MGVEELPAFLILTTRFTHSLCATYYNLHKFIWYNIERSHFKLAACKILFMDYQIPKSNVGYSRSSPSSLSHSPDSVDIKFLPLGYHKQLFYFVNSNLNLDTVIKTSTWIIMRHRIQCELYIIFYVITFRLRHLQILYIHTCTQREARVGWSEHFEKNNASDVMLGRLHLVQEKKQFEC